MEKNRCAANRVGDCFPADRKSGTALLGKHSIERCAIKQRNKYASNIKVSRDIFHIKKLFGVITLKDKKNCVDRKNGENWEKTMRNFDKKNDMTKKTSNIQY